MKFFRMIIIAGEVLLVALLLLGIVSKFTGYIDINNKANNTNEKHINLDDELSKKLLSYNMVE